MGNIFIQINKLMHKFISKKELKVFKDTKLNLKKRKIEILNEANSYTEEVRRAIKDKSSFKYKSYLLSNFSFIIL